MLVAPILHIGKPRGVTVRFKNFRVKNLGDLLKTFEVFEIQVFDPGLKPFETFYTEFSNSSSGKFLNLTVNKLRV